VVQMYFHRWDAEVGADLDQECCKHRSQCREPMEKSGFRIS